MRKGTVEVGVDVINMGTDLGGGVGRGCRRHRMSFGEFGI